jgi:small-conductance mechanosensitive channel
MRDHKQADRIEALDQQCDQLAEQVTQMLQQLVSMEELLSDHVHNTLREHSTQLAELRDLLTAVHACVVTDGATPATATPPPAAPTTAATPPDAPAPKAPRKPNE